MHRPKAFAKQITVKPASKAGGGTFCIENDDGVTICYPSIASKHSWQLEDVNASTGLLGVKTNMVKANRRVKVTKITTLLLPGKPNLGLISNVNINPSQN